LTLVPKDQIKYSKNSVAAQVAIRSKVSEVTFIMQGCKIDHERCQQNEKKKKAFLKKEGRKCLGEPRESNQEALCLL
jgi:hypothetical protein